MGAIRVTAGELRAIEIAEERSLPLVGAGPADRVQQPSGEIALPDIEWRCDDLKLLHGLGHQGEETEGALIARDAEDAVPESLHIVVGATVDHNAVETVVLSCERQVAVGARSHLRRQQRQPGEVALDHGETNDGGAGDRERRSGAAGVDAGVRFSVDGQLLELKCGRVEREVQSRALA